MMPWSIRLAKLFIILRIVIMVAVMLFTTYFIMNGSPAEGFLVEVQKMLFNRFGINSIDDSTYNLGILTGSLLLPIAAMMAQLILINTQKRYAMLLIISAMEIVLAFARFSFPFMGLAIFVLLLWPTSREYFRGDEDSKKRESILDDMEF